MRSAVKTPDRVYGISIFATMRPVSAKLDGLAVIKAHVELITLAGPVHGGEVAGTDMSVTVRVNYPTASSQTPLVGMPTMKT